MRQTAKEEPSHSARPAAPASTTPVGKPVPVNVADEHFRKGDVLFKAKKLAEAEASYEVVWVAKKTHDIAANPAYTEMCKGKHREAAGHLAFAVRSWSDELVRRYGMHKVTLPAVVSQVHEA